MPRISFVILGRNNYRGADTMNNKLVDLHLGSDMSFGDLDRDMFNVLKGTI